MMRSALVIKLSLPDMNRTKIELKNLMFFAYHSTIQEESAPVDCICDYFAVEISRCR